METLAVLPLAHLRNAINEFVLGSRMMVSTLSISFSQLFDRGTQSGTSLASASGVSVLPVVSALALDFLRRLGSAGVSDSALTLPIDLRFRTATGFSGRPP